MAGEPGDVARFHRYLLVSAAIGGALLARVVDAHGDGKGLAEIKVKNKLLVLAAINNDSLQTREFSIPPGAQVISLKQNETYAIIHVANGQLIRRECYHGVGYLSASGRYLHVPFQAKSVEIFTNKGLSRKLLF